MMMTMMMVLMMITGSIQEYALDIWDLTPFRRPHPTEDEVMGVSRVRSFPNLDPATLVELHVTPTPAVIAASLRKYGGSPMLGLAAGSL